MNWIILIVAGLCECAFTFCLSNAKLVTGTAHYLWFGGFAGFTVASMVLLMTASRTLPLSIAYPLWTGIGAVGTVLCAVHARTADRVAAIFRVPAYRGRYRSENRFRLIPHSP